MYKELNNLINNYQTMTSENVYRSMEIINQTLSNSNINGSDIPKEILGRDNDILHIYNKIEQLKLEDTEKATTVISNVIMFMLGTEYSLNSQSKWVGETGSWSGEIAMTIPSAIVRHFITEEYILTGRASLHTKAIITLSSLPIQYYGKEYPYLRFMGRVESNTIEYEEYRNNKHTNLKTSAINVINSYLDDNIGIQDFEETLYELDIYSNIDKVLPYINKKEQFLSIINEWSDYIEN